MKPIRHKKRKEKNLKINLEKEEDALIVAVQISIPLKRGTVLQEVSLLDFFL